MSKLLNLAKWTLTLGSEPQNFLGAKWIPAFLQRVPEKSRRKWALRILNLSPHYFIDGDNPAFKDMSTDEYLETSFEIISESRREIYEKVFEKHLERDFKILEYGCGPGFVAKAIAPHVEKIYACDISTGALACGEIINAADNVEYILADEKGLSLIPDRSLDAVYSFAVIQHLTDEVFEIVLENCRRKLKPNGKLLLHIQLADDVWKTEDDWKSDTSLQGKIKYKYGLHCFGRTKEKHSEMVKKHGFAEIAFESLEALANENSSETDSQYLLTARKEL
jgi:SAM-dependent methyltransferase